jgi:phage gp29-like protein
MPRSSKPSNVARSLLLPYQTGIKPTWTIKQIRSALTQHQMGSLGLSSLLFDSMLEDDEFPGTLKRRVDATLKSDFCLKPVQKESQPAKSAAPGPQKAAAPGAVERDDTKPAPVEPIEPASELTPDQKKAADLWNDMVPYGQMLRFVADLLVMGEAFGTLDWDTKTYPGLWVPVFRALPTEFARWDHESRSWKYQAKVLRAERVGGEPVPTSGGEGLELTVTPGDGKWIHASLGDRGWLWGAVRGLALLWLGKQMTFCDWQRWCEKHGLPITKAILPIYRDEDEKDEFIAELGEMQREGIVGLPQDEEGKGYDLDLLEPKTVSWQGFQASLERSDRKIQVTLLGGNLGAEVTRSGGNMGAAETHSSELEKLAKTDAGLLAEVLKKQLLKPFFELNFGPDAAKELPTPFWDTCPDEDVRSWTTAQGQFAVTVKTLGEAGYEILNMGDYAARFDLKLAKKPKSEMPIDPNSPESIAAKAATKAPAKPGAPSASAASTAK